MAVILLRTLFVYLMLILIMRLMGKRQLGELEVTDLVTTLLISELAALPITNREIPLSHSLIPMITLMALEVLSSWVLVRFPKLRPLVSARPAVIIRHGVLDQKALRELRLSPEELMSEIRQAGLLSPEQVEYAILEKNGKMTVLPKSQYMPPSAEDLGIKSQQESLMHIVYCNGCFNQPGLALIGKDQRWLKKQLERRGTSLSRIFCATANDLGKLYLIYKEGNEL